MSAVCTS
jgi:leukotriene-A4 hydrolase